MQPLGPPPKMRVLITTEDFNPGGFTSHTCNLGRALRALGHHVSALVFEPFGSEYCNMARSTDDILVPRRGFETRRHFLRRIVAEIGKAAPDIWINNAMPFSQAALPYLNTRMARISVVHTAVERQLPVSIAGRSHLDWIIAVAENAAAGIRRLAPDWTRLRVIPVAVPLSVQRAPERTVGPIPRLVFMGRLVAEKNVPGLVAVLDLLHSLSFPFYLTVIGDGAEGRWLREQLKSRPYHANVTLTGALSHDEAMRELSRQDVMLHTSTYDATPHAVLEAMAAGVAVVCSRLPGGTDRIIEDGVNGFLCDPKAPETYGHALRQLCHNSTVYHNTTQRGYETIATTYSPGVVASQYLDCASNRAGRPFSLDRLHPPPAPSVSEELKPYCLGVVRQCKHRVADAVKGLAFGRKPIRSEGLGGKVAA